MIHPRRAVAVSCAIAAALGVAGAQEAPDEPTAQALLARVGFTRHEIERINAREIVARTNDAEGSAVALAVATIMDVPAAFYLEKFRAIESFKTSPEVKQIGRFGRIPSAADIAPLLLEEEDVDDLRGCRPGSCGLKLDADGIARIARRDARLDTASSAMRSHLAAYAARYLASGNGALMEYRSTSQPRRILDELAAILARTQYLRQYWPVLFDAVANYSGSLPAGLEGFVYWSKEKVGPRAVISLTHVVISPVQNRRAAVATKGLYASHYGDGSLGLTMLFEEGTPAAPRTLVVYTNRSRLDVLGGIFGAIKRPLVRSRARDGAERTMRALRERTERQYRERSAGRVSFIEAQED
jgi:hypothetical protein